ncbi:MAG: hypothetical protein JWO31_275 [Phycisphaerales bacterium]|nr:hypothetical protein [Phycisphaerales bacterium]
MAEQAEQPCKVLVVDDHGDTADLTSRLLSYQGYEVRVANGYQEAIEAARAARFDVMVCDVGLGDGDGCDLLAEVRAMYEVRAVALTGYGMKADRARCERAGFGHFLLKPVSLEDLKAAVDSASDGLPCADVERGVSL